MRRRGVGPSTLIAAWWALRALRVARRDLRRMPVGRLRLPIPPPLPHRAARGVTGVLIIRGASCLERSLILQRWLAAHEQPCDVVIGVTAPTAGFEAHAWLEGEPARGYHEVARVAP
jgi:hypothetical protein